jgi:putative NADH-flavin reductase
LLDIMQQLEKKLEEAERKQLAAVGGAGAVVIDIQQPGVQTAPPSET